MENVVLEKKDFEKMYEKLLFLYNIGELNMVEMSKFAIIANKCGYKTNYSFKLVKQ